MNLEYHDNNGYSYYTVDNYFTDEEIDELRRLFKFVKPYLRAPEDTGSSMTGDGAKYKKKNKGIFLFDMQPVPLIASEMSVRLFELIRKNEHMFKPDSVYANSLMTNWSSVLLSYYEDSDYYNAHKDSTTITAVFWLDLFERNYTGGDLVFDDCGTVIESKHNTGIIFPGHYNHSVTPVKTIDHRKENGGRLALSLFSGIDRDSGPDIPQLIPVEEDQ